MNKERRKQIDEAIKLLEQAKPLIEDATSMIETAKDEERDFYDNMPENMQSGDKGQAADAAADALEEVHTSLDEFNIDDMVTKLNEAQDG